MKYELVDARDCFDDNNGGLIYGIHWLEFDDNIIDCSWFKTIGERSNAITKLEIYDLEKDDLYNLTITYSNYVARLSEEEGSYPACLEEFYENDYKEILKKD